MYYTLKSSCDIINNMEYAIEVIKAVEKILGEGNAYLVGGAPRDIIMGNDPKDYDMCGPLKPEEVEILCKKAGRRYYGVGKHFGVSGFKVQTSRGYELVEYTTYRNEVYTAKSRKPDVTYVDSLDDELSRRDFTCNAIVIKPDGTIYDKFGGRLDIYAKQIKTVGLPKDRIQEDPLRILRAARFAARYGFKIDPNFIGKARQLADRIFDVSVERWVMELDKMLTSNHTWQGLSALEQMGVLSRIFPEITSVPPFVDRFDDADWAWKYLLNDVNVSENIKEPTRTKRFVQTGICHRFKFSNSRTDFILDKTGKKD